MTLPESLDRFGARYEIVKGFTVKPLCSCPSERACEIRQIPYAYLTLIGLSLFPNISAAYLTNGILKRQTHNPVNLLILKILVQTNRNTNP